MWLRRNPLLWLAFVGLLSVAAFHAFYGPGPKAPFSTKVRGLDIVSFWAPGAALDSGDADKMYTRSRVRQEFKRLNPDKPSGYPIGYPPPIYQLFAIPQPRFDYFGVAQAVLLITAVMHTVGALFAVAAVHVPSAVRAGRLWTLLIPALAVAAPAAFSSAMSGQLAGLWSLAAGLGLWLRSQGRLRWAGVALSVLFLKPTLAAPFALALLLLGELQCLLGLLLGGLAILAASLAADGLTPWVAYVERLGNADKLLDDFWIYRVRQVNIRSLAGLLSPSKAVGELAGWAAAGVTLLSLGAYAWSSRREATRPDSDRLRADLRVGAVLAWALMAGPHMLEYDLGTESFGMAASAAWLLAGRARNPRWGWASLLAAWGASMLTWPPGMPAWGLAAMAVLGWLAWLVAELLAGAPAAQRPENR